MGIVTWILVGIVLGAIASFIIGKSNVVTSVIVGLFGAGLAGWISTLFGVGTFTAFSLWNLLISIGGAAALLAVLGLILRSREA